MIGALIGDIAGSRFEHNNHKSKVFTLLSAENGCRLTDDSIMTLAIARAVLDCRGCYNNLEQQAISCMQQFGRKYPSAGYGERFKQWIWADNPQPYNSYGNGAAMRVSACGYAAGSVSEAAVLARAVTGVSHNHPEALKAAQAVSEAIYIARGGAKLSDIREYIELCYYPINFTLDDIRENYCFDVSCQGSVPQAFLAFFEAGDFEDAIRNAVSIGGDSDTIAAIAGALAGAYFGVPDHLREEALPFLDDDLKTVLFAFEKKFGLFDHRTENELAFMRSLAEGTGFEYDITKESDAEYMQHRREYGPYSKMFELAKQLKRDKSEDIRARETDFIRDMVLCDQNIQRRPDPNLVKQWMKEEPKTFLLDEALWPDVPFEDNKEAYYVRTDSAFLNYAEVLRLELQALQYMPERIRLGLYFLRVIDTYHMEKTSTHVQGNISDYERHFNRIYEQFYTIIMDGTDPFSVMEEDNEHFYYNWGTQFEDVQEALSDPDTGMIPNLEKENYEALRLNGNKEKLIAFAKKLYSDFLRYSGVSGFVPRSAVLCMFSILYLFHGLFVRRTAGFRQYEKEYCEVFEELYQALLEGKGYVKF